MSRVQQSKKAKVAARKRKVRESSNTTLTRLNTWFTDEQHKKDYVTIFGNKNIILPKYIEVQYFKDEGFSFHAMLEYQGLTQLVELNSVFYPELVKVFYTTSRATLQGTLTAHINGRKITIDEFI